MELGLTERIARRRLIRQMISMALDDVIETGVDDIVEELRRMYSRETEAILKFAPDGVEA